MFSAVVCVTQTLISHRRLQQNFSLSGALHPLSKLIICVVMLRGRHRGLPVALDRAVMLPQEFRKRVDGDHDGNSEGPPSPNTTPAEGLTPEDASNEVAESSSSGQGSGQSSGEKLSEPRQSDVSSSETNQKDPTEHAVVTI